MKDYIIFFQFLIIAILFVFLNKMKVETCVPALEGYGNTKSIHQSQYSETKNEESNG